MLPQTNGFDFIGMKPREGISIMSTTAHHLFYTVGTVCFSRQLSDCKNVTIRIP
jgi:hypothetical protein